MEPKRIARFAGVLVALVIALLIVVFNSYGVVRLADSLGVLWFLVIGALLTLAFQLIVYPERFVPRSKSESMPVPTPIQHRLKGIEIYRNNDE